MKRLLTKYASPLLIIGALLFALSFGVETFLYGGFEYRLGYYYFPFRDPFPKGPHTNLLFSLALSGLLLVIVAFIFADKKKGGSS